MPTWLQEILQKFADETLDEVLVNSTKSLILSSGGRCLDQLQVSLFANTKDMGLALQEFALSQGLRLDHLCPAAGGMFQESLFRWHAIIPPASGQEPVFALRRHRFKSLSLGSFAISADQLQLLKRLFRERVPLIVAGPTGSGKTSLLACLLQKYAGSERVVVIEELAELPLLGPGWVRLLAKEANIDGRGEISIPRLVKDSLRIRPDRVVLGELQRGQLAAFVESIWAGHGGTCATFHGGSHMAVVRRFISLLAGEVKSVADGIMHELEDVGLWCVVMERGTPPRVVSVRRFSAPEREP